MLLRERAARLCALCALGRIGAGHNGGHRDPMRDALLHQLRRRLLTPTRRLTNEERAIFPQKRANEARSRDAFESELEWMSVCGTPQSNYHNLIRS